MLGAELNFSVLSKPLHLLPDAHIGRILLPTCVFFVLFSVFALRVKVFVCSVCFSRLKANQLSVGFHLIFQGPVVVLLRRLRNEFAIIFPLSIVTSAASCL